MVRQNKIFLKSQLVFLLLLLFYPSRYSLASSPRRSGPKQIDLVLSVVKYTTGKNGIVRRGFCSNYMKTLKVGSLVKCVHREIVAMQKPLRAEKPIVFVAAGSGIAPFR